MEVKGINMFVKGDIVYCLLSATSQPNLLIPSKCRIIDIEYEDENNPIYLVQILKFYDDFNFIKENYIQRSFKYARRSTANDATVKNRYSPNKIRQYTNINTLADIYRILGGEVETVVVDDKGKQTNNKTFTERKERHYITAEALFCYKTKAEMLKNLDQIHEFKIFQIIREFKKFTTRKLYDGMFKVNGVDEFEIGIQKLFTDNNMTAEKFKKIKEMI